ncbi:26823_t:CDS:2, partial [Dentiscutata erythropus]
MKSYETVNKSLSNFDLELVEMKKYISFDNSAECSAQASLKNYNDGEVLAERFNPDSEEVPAKRFNSDSEE